MPRDPRGEGGGVSVTISTSGVNHQGYKQDLINIAMLTLRNIIDDDCRSWLQGGEVNNFDVFTQNLVDNGVVGHGSITTTQTNTTINAVTNPPDAPGLSIVINDSGAFYNSGASTDNEKIPGGTLAADVFILLHEYAHLNRVPGFENDAGDSGAGRRNNNRVEEHCSKTLGKEVLR